MVRADQNKRKVRTPYPTGMKLYLASMQIKADQRKARCSKQNLLGTTKENQTSYKLNNH